MNYELFADYTSLRGCERRSNPENINNRLLRYARNDGKLFAFCQLFSMFSPLSSYSVGTEYGVESGYVQQSQDG